MIKLICALGNPGNQYEFTRHNIGWLVMDQISDSLSLSWNDKFKGQYSSKNIQNEMVYFLKPMTYMNLSGQSVVASMNFYKIHIDELLVIHDEIDLPFGTISLKKGGGLAGHNGLKSIAQLTGTSEFKRVRMGVGRPLHGSVSSWVLSSFSSDDEISLEKFLLGGRDAVLASLVESFEKASNQFSKKSFL